MRRIEGFWLEFSHNKIGLVGLTVILIFVAVSLLQAPLATLSYPNPETQGLAHEYAYPEWVCVLSPAMRNLPRTSDYFINWSSASPLPDTVTIHREANKWIIEYSGNTSIVVPLEGKFYYQYDPPRNFYYSFSWGAKPQVIKPTPYTSISIARYSLELNLTTPDGTTYPVWDQHWWKYKAITTCMINNPYYDPGLDPDYHIGTYTHSERFYPSGPEYENHWKKYTPLWKLPGFYDYQPAYGLYKNWTSLSRLEKEVGSHIPTWDTIVSNESTHITVTRYPPIRLGYGEPDTVEMTHDLFYPNGEFTFHMYITIQPTQPNAACEVSVTRLHVHVPGLAWGLMGTDCLGRDVWARLIYGARISLSVGIAAAIIATGLGILVGIVAGYSGGLTDEALMRLVDILLCLPVLPLLMVLVVLFGRNIIYIILIIAIFGWLGLSRLIRSQTLSLREMPFVECAAASGAPSSYIMARHLLPNVLPVALADFVLSVPGAILLEAALSFIGFGDPSTPTWGREFSFIRDWGIWQHGIGFIWWWVLPPGIAITVLCVAFVFVGHAVDEIVNPRLRRRR